MDIIEEFKEHSDQKDFLIKTEIGMFIYKIFDIKNGKVPEYSEIKRELAEYLIEEAIKEIKENIIQELMDKAEIKYLDTSILEE